MRDLTARRTYRSSWSRERLMVMRLQAMTRTGMTCWLRSRGTSAASCGDPEQSTHVTHTEAQWHWRVKLNNLPLFQTPQYSDRAHRQPIIYRHVNLSVEYCTVYIRRWWMTFEWIVNPEGNMKYLARISTIIKLVSRLCIWNMVHRHSGHQRQYYL